MSAAGTAAPVAPGSTSAGDRAAGRATPAAPVVLGGGVSGASRARARWRTWRWPLLVVLVVVLAGLVGALVRPTLSAERFGTDNPAPDGARALAQILGEQGVRITTVRSTAEAVAAAQAGTTLLVVETYLLSDTQIADLAATDADLVLASPEGYHLPLFTQGALEGGWGLTGPAAARCTDPDAQAAERVESWGYGIRSTGPGTVLCFPADGEPTMGAYAALEVDGRRVVVLDDAGWLTNARLAEDGNAALVLRALGHHEQLTWYLPSVGDTTATVPVGAMLPGWAGPVAAQLAVVVLALALWRGRALGPVVTEPLPVTVRAAETALGRGRLYRRARSRGHAAASLRAGTARRTAARLGLPRTAGATAVIDAVVRATGRPTEQVAGLLYGPPPTDDVGLLALARLLDHLESEVHRP